MNVQGLKPILVSFDKRWEDRFIKFFFIDNVNAASLDDMASVRNAILILHLLVVY